MFYSSYSSYDAVDLLIYSKFQKTIYRYNTYWKEKIANGVKIEDVCFKIKTNTGKNDKGLNK